MPTTKKTTENTVDEAVATPATPVEKKAPRASKAKASGTYVYAIGRRKSSTAKINLFEGGSGNITVNGKSAKDYFAYDPFERLVFEPLTILGVDKNYDVTVTALGGGLSGQAQATAHGIARALLKKDEGYKIPLKGAGLLTRDPRMKERKKPGLKRARKAPQWSKR
ncbi:MAG TPA: 30S ribosomal protein S9 [Flavobacterium sp.]|nr:30S ribosomal protein S9 [Flavobacterium sp.]